MTKRGLTQRAVAGSPRKRKEMEPWGAAEERASWYLLRFSTQIPLARCQLQALATRAAEGDTTARERLVEAYLPLVARLAARYQGCGLSLADLLQEGSSGILVAIKFFKPAYKNSFNAYVTRNIKWAMHRAVRENMCWYKLSSAIQRTIDAVSYRSNQLFQEYGCDVIDEECTREIELDEETIDHLRVVTQPPLSLENSSTEETDGSTGETLLDLLQEPFSLEEDVLRRELRAHVLQALLELPQRERVVLLLRYGFFGGRDYTLREIGRLLRITSERVRQIEERALRTLRMHASPTAPAIHSLNRLMEER